MKQFYQQTKDQALTKLLVDPKIGLTTEQVQQNRQLYGRNQLPEKKKDPYWKIFLRSFKEPIIIVLLGAVILSFLSSIYAFRTQNNPQHGLEALYEAIVILILIIINAFLGFWQEISAQKNLDALREMNNRIATVYRNKEWQTIATKDIVVSDLLKVKLGDFVEADVRWIQADELQVIESHLTGEADAIAKNSATINQEAELGDRFNMGYSGSTVANGQGIGLVVGIGENTELGNISRLIDSVEEKVSPLQKTINKLTKTLMKVSAGIVILTFIIGILRAGELSINSITSVLSTSIALAVASIPDALPAVLSIVLTIGASKMAQNKGLIKSLDSVETLGSTSYICSDKTGTLTQNEMTATKFYDGEETFNVSGLGYAPTGKIESTTGSTAKTSIFLKGAVLCNEATIKEENGKFLPFGNPTEIALTVLGQKAGLTKEALLKNNQLIRTLPFTSDRKMMSVVIKNDTGYWLYTKGAPDVLLRNSQNILLNGKTVATQNAEAEFMKIVDSFANEALRTLAVGFRQLTENQARKETVEKLETDLTIVGVAGIIDPPRPEVKQSVKTLNEANIEVVMITGDHANTARAIAYDLGIVKTKDAKVVNGLEIEKMTDDELFKTVPTTNIYARVSPEHKQRIIKQLQHHQQVVAMTGDGVNDAPALRVADIGIAMGINGTEVTKDSADLILLDDKFTTIEKSVKSGRTIYANIKNFMRHELTTNIAEVLALLLGLLLFSKTIGQVPAGTPTLTALMVLWVNMVSDALPSFALGYDVAEADIMKEDPRDPNESVLANHTWSRVLIRGTIMGAMVYLSFWWAANIGMSSSEAQTVAFLTLVFGQLWHVFDARSSHSLFRRNPFGNRNLVLAVLFAGITSILVTILPFFNLVMGTANLPAWIYLLVIFVPALPTFILSGLKEIFGITIW
ncbi:cation-translocating P-type ATPase [Companilactobacillus crustorum]|uniref:cation-translocating P-type ATPase n=1 Tax=Companilactobacillus crustorum TaxID=392416 RepID=UPI0009579718|nr:cation-transporting P-type ATPase [Companilactobacillus crustorum]APU72346.1 hypothetical protein BI355_2052 [Companilactobacillus crustorum]